MGVAPGLAVKEFIFQTYAPRLSDVKACIVGGATKGPLNTPTLCNTEPDLVRKFGPPVSNDYGLQSACEILRSGAPVVYLRVAHASPVTASVAVTGTGIVTTAAAATGTITIGTISASATVTITDSDSTSKIFEFVSANGTGTAGNVWVTLGSTAAISAANLAAAINATAFKVSAVTPTSNIVTVNSKTLGASGNKTIAPTSGITTTSLTGGVDQVTGAAATAFTVSAASPGTWANGMTLTLTATTIKGAPAGRYDLTVSIAPPGSTVAEVVERFYNLSPTSGDARCIDTVLKNGIVGEVGPSQYITAGTVTTVPIMTYATFSLASGTDGISGLVDSDYVGTVSGSTTTGLRALENVETVEFNVLAIPHAALPASVITQVIGTSTSSLMNLRMDFFFVIDAPFGVGCDVAVNWADGTDNSVANHPTTALDNARAGVFAPWHWTSDPYTKTQIILPPCGGVIAAMGENDAAHGPFWPVAGIQMGIVPGYKLEYSPNQTMREAMVGVGSINPIVQTTYGLAIMGNRTLQRNFGPMQEISTVRMLIFVEKAIATLAQYVQFQPNDPVTWAKMSVMANDVMSRVLTKRGIKSFRYTCDATTNPDAQRALREMRGRVEIVKQDWAEKITLDVSVTASGASVNIAQ